MNTVLLLMQVAIISMALGAVFYFANKRLGSYFVERPHLKFRYQMIQIAGGLIAVLCIILFMPFGDTLRGQLLRLYGLIFSATIALSVSGTESTLSRRCCCSWRRCSRSLRA